MQLSNDGKDEMQVRMRVELQLLGQPAVRGISALCHSPFSWMLPFPRSLPPGTPQSPRLALAPFMSPP